VSVLANRHDGERPRYVTGLQAPERTVKGC
jgi:hypothetical protein